MSDNETRNVTQAFPELGFYALAGAPTSNRDIIDEVRQAEHMGLGTAFISERYNVKEAAVLCGAAGAVTERIRIATGVTNPNTREPMVTASMACTMNELTDGRFVLGLGRGIATLQTLYAIPQVTTAELIDAAEVLRKVLGGGMVMGHQGATGWKGMLYLGAGTPANVPLLVSAFGPVTLAAGGRTFDEVLLHTYFTDETTTRAVETVKNAAMQAGRDPDDVVVWSCLATVGDHLETEVQLRKTVGRLATYLQGYGDLLVRTNRWDPEVLDRFRSSQVVTSIGGAIDQVATTGQLEAIAELLPPEWLSAAATGTPSQCVDAIEAQFALGCDRVILHGASPDELAPIIDEYASRTGPSDAAAEDRRRARERALRLDAARRTNRSPREPSGQPSNDRTGAAVDGRAGAPTDLIVHSLDDITAEWTTRALVAGGAIGEDQTIEHVTVTQIGTGQMGVCARVEFARPDAPASPDGPVGARGPGSVVVKFASPSPMVRSFMGPTGYLGEVGFYRDLAGQVAIRMPRASVCQYDGDDSSFTLVLDDLAPAVPGDQLEGITLDEAHIAIEELVRLHGPRWNDPTLRDEPALAPLTEGEAMIQTVYTMAVPGFLTRFGPVLDRHGREVCELLMTGTERWLERGPSVKTLVHGDYRPDNLLFDRTGSPTTISAVDWQGVRSSAGQIDIAFLFGTALDPDIFERNEDALLRRWFDGIQRFGVVYDWDACTADYRWASIGALQTTIFGAAFSEPTARGEQMFTRMITGQMRLIARLNAIELLR
ncbi:MAG: TIGR03857 family LLM class F420-dependent oxidoreductase [Acidimicrobiia bacterium]|nr:TIGR03857 family LLM class F420-dependent oxidoreductase [Acidimicrobiia bacterium]